MQWPVYEPNAFPVAGPRPSLQYAFPGGVPPFSTLSSFRPKRSHRIRNFVGCIMYPCIVCLRPQLSTSSHPPADFILFHSIFRRYVKHATLVEGCFPAEKSSETTPNSNELSYLVYYAQSKPAKLTKVGAYLSKRIAKDTYKLRRTDVLVGLHIYNALLAACGRDLYFFAKDVLGSLETVLAANDFEFAKAATHTFALFCRSHSGATLAIDKGLRSLYTNLITTFAGYARAKVEDPTNRKKAALGLCAIQAIAESQATYAADNYYELPRIVKAVAARITKSAEIGDNPAEAIAVEKQIASIGDSSTESTSTSSSLDDQQLGIWAWRCLETLVQKSHGQHSRIIISEVFKYLDSHLQWQPNQLCVDVVTAVISRLQTQDQNMVIVETLAFLTDGTLSSHMYLESGRHRENSVLASMEKDTAEHGAGDSGKTSNRRTCIIRILESMFCQPYVLVGISVMEALNVLVTFLLETVAGDRPAMPDYSLFESALTTATSPAAAAVSDGPGLIDSTGPLSDYYHLLAAIGGLAMHQYYSSQLADMVGYLVSQMQLGDESGSTQRQQWLLQALYMVLRCTNSGAGSLASSNGGRDAPYDAANLSLETFAPLFTLLTHDSWDLHAQAADCIVEILRHNCHCSADPGWASAWSPGLVDAVYCKLSGSLVRAYAYQPTALRSAAYAATLAIFCELIDIQGANSVYNTVWALDEATPAQENSSWVTLTAIVWKKIAALELCAQLESHIDLATKEAQGMDCWDTVVDDVCARNIRVMTISVFGDPAIATSPFSNSADAGVQIRARDIAKKLSVKAALECLGPEAASKYADSKAKRADSRADALDSESAVDRVLCGATTAGGNGYDEISGDIAISPSSALDQIKGIRARVSVDWEAQMRRREPSPSPKVNLEHLRAALKDGLSMRSSDHVNDIDQRMRARGALSGLSIVHGKGKQLRQVSNTYSTTSASSCGQHELYPVDSGDSTDESDTRKPARSFEDDAENKLQQRLKLEQHNALLAMGVDARNRPSMVDASGQPVPDEVRDLLDSINDGSGEFQFSGPVSENAACCAHANLDDTHGSSAVSTPVIDHVS
ncbi:plasma membrane localization protein [Kickxella alabastrina]|nr:plasma membrane localization protein [Kickxella alabastrina]